MRAPPPAPEWAQRLFTVGVTGTNGKTTTTTMLAAALGRLTRPVARVTTLGCFLDDERLDVPFDYDGFLATMRRCLDRGGEYAAIELTSEAMARGFAAAWRSRVGVFTNMTRDHLDAHGSVEHYLASKAQLFLHLPAGGVAVLNGCDPASALLAEVVPKGVSIVRYGAASRGEAESPLDLSARSVDVRWSGTALALGRGPGFEGYPEQLSTRAIGAIFAENALAALAGAVSAGVPPAVAAAAIAEVAPPAGRFEVVAERPYVVVDYAHTPDALARTLATAKHLARGRVVVVFGAGGNRDQKKRPLMGAAARAAERVVLTSDNPRDEDPARIAAAVREGVAPHADVLVELDRRRAIEGAIADAGEEDVVLIAGKGHESDQTIRGVRARFSDAEIARAAHARRRSVLPEPAAPRYRSRGMLPSDTHLIYKVCPAAEWNDAAASGSYRGAAVDLRDGFIHFSTSAQLPETLRRHFAGKRDLVLVAIDPEELGAGLRWEPSRGGELFPHLYGELPVALARSVSPLDVDSEGRPHRAV